LAPGPTAMRRALRLRITAVTVLAAGVIGIGLVYWVASRSVDYSDNPAMLGYDKSRLRQSAYFWGNQGVLVQGLIDDLKQPDTQAIIIVAAAGLVASACFYVARRLELAGGGADGES